MLIDLMLLLVLAAVVFWAVRRGFFATVLRLGAWIVSLAVSRVLGEALSAPLYNAFAAQPARRMVEANIGQAMDGSQAAQYAQQVIAELPDALSQLAERVGGVAPEQLIENLDAQQFTAANAAYVIEQSIIAPIGTAIIQLALTLLLFVVLLVAARLICRRLERVRKLPVLRQADKILGGALGAVKGVLLLFVLVLVLQAAAALSQEGSAFAQMVDGSWIVRALSF